ncbi:hypothetical protein ABZ929_28695 [Streptomyces physcomitrii]|uniref:hypothetical protein n=1 Tax=Streptomyces physcomitrii TaxID=2724184 RepID=UPI00341F256D
MEGKKRPDPPDGPLGGPAPEVFAVTDLERRTPDGKPVRGRLAVRVPRSEEGTEHFPPHLWVVPAEDASRGYELYETEGEAALLCRVEPVPGAGGERFRVKDELGTELGTVQRTPAAKRTVQHSWWIQQPGHGEAVARYHWAKPAAVEAGEDSGGRLFGGMLGAFTDPGAEGGEAVPFIRRPVTWEADNEVVLTAQQHTGYRSYRVHADWFDARLGFALALLREG